MGAYAFRSIGTTASSTTGGALSPGAPTGKEIGDLLILFTGSLVSGTINDITSTWTSLFEDIDATTPSFYLYARIADGTASDTPTGIDWTGTDDCFAVIVCYEGDVYTDLGTIVHNTAASAGGGQASNIALSSLTITTDNTLVIAAGVKTKTATSNDTTTITANGGLTKRMQFISLGTAIIACYADSQQTAATNYDGSDFTRDGTNQTTNHSSVVLSLLSEEDSVPLEAITLRWRQ